MRRCIAINDSSVGWEGISNIEQGISKDEVTRGDDYDLQDRLIGFGVRVMSVVEALRDTHIGNHVSHQLLRSGTSPAANYAEAQGAESRKDFIHKMKISLKELRETHVWLIMTQRKPLLEPPEKLDEIIRECNELISIFVSSIKTAANDK